MSELGWMRSWPRRSFLKAGVAGFASLAIPAIDVPAFGESAAGPQLRRISPSLAVFRGTVHVGVLLNGDEALLIDCGDVGTLDWARDAGIRVRKVLATHHHREQVAALLQSPEGIDVLVPAAEEKYFTDVSQYWNAPSSRWHIYNQHPHHWMLPEPVKVSGVIRAGKTLTWGMTTIKALETPGHTDGALSFVVTVDGLKVVFCGDLVHGPGQIPDLYCLQKGFQRGQRRITDYHGFLGSRETLKESLHLILEEKPDLMVSSSGGVIDDPETSVRLLMDRVETLYDNYVSTSALRHYFPELFQEFRGRPDHLPFVPTREPPKYLRHIGTSWILLSQDGAAFVMDCGSPGVVEAIEKMITAGEISRVEGLWITHYHDDHVNAVPHFQEKFKCPCYAVPSVAEVITRPMAWRLPCISPSVAHVDHVLSDGESFSWHEFQLTGYELPGQTLYHGGLLVKRDTDRLLFVGDSFTPAGIDDYCIQNRNFLHENMGFLRCLDLVSQLQPTHMFNCHVDSAFTFRPDDCRAIQERLRRRREMLKEILPWRDPHFGMDEFWIRCDPYEQVVSPGQKAAIGLVVFNHLGDPLEVHLRLVPPSPWMKTSAPGAAQSWKDWPSLVVPGRSEQRLPVDVSIPVGVSSGRFVITVDVAIPGEAPYPRILCGFTEAIIVVEA